MLEKNKILWVIDPKRVFPIVESIIAENIVVKKFESVRKCESFLRKIRITEKKNPQMDIHYPELVFFFPEVIGRRLRDMSPATKLIHAIQQKNPATNSFAFCAIPRMQDKLLQAGFKNAPRFEGGERVRELLNSTS
jgi:hypothetical protein